MPDRNIIERVWAREILNSRGHPAVEAEVVLRGGAHGIAAAPMGISAGKREAVPLVDGDVRRYRGRGVLKAVENVRSRIAPAIVGMSACNQSGIDQRLRELDGTEDKRSLGANAMLSVSLAAADAAAHGEGMPLYRYLGGRGPMRLPVPVFDVIGGGVHAEGSVDVQEYLLIPAGVSCYREAVRAGAEVYEALVGVLREWGYRVDYGAPLAVPLPSNKRAMDALLIAIERAGYEPDVDCFVGVDAAMSEMYHDGGYQLKSEQRVLSTAEMIDYWADWERTFGILSIEDGLSEDDWEGWDELTARLGDRVQLVGDDLFTTNPAQVVKGIQRRSANAVLIKPNQIGTLSEVLQTARIAREAGWGTMASERSGEVEHTTLADIAVGLDLGQVKTGPPVAERTVRHNRLMRIEDELGDEAEYAGLATFRAGER